jgi:hypothetical protein
MRMTSDEFWNSSLTEFIMAIEGFAEFHSSGSPSPLTKNELDDLRERYPD